MCIYPRNELSREQGGTADLRKSRLLINGRGYRFPISFMAIGLRFAEPPNHWVNRPLEKEPIL